MSSQDTSNTVDRRVQHASEDESKPIRGPIYMDTRIARFIAYHRNHEVRRRLDGKEHRESTGPVHNGTKCQKFNGVRIRDEPTASKIIMIEESTNTLKQSVFV